MEATQILIENGYDEHKYKSPTYIRKLKKQTWETADCGDKVQNHYEKRPEEDKFLEWLVKNSLFKLIEAWKGHFHSDYTYILMGSNGVLCAVHAKNNGSGDSVLNPGDYVYYYDVTIRSQPKGKNLPDELEEILDSLEYMKK